MKESNLHGHGDLDCDHPSLEDGVGLEDRLGHKHRAHVVIALRDSALHLSHLGRSRH